MAARLEPWLKQVVSIEVVSVNTNTMTGLPSHYEVWATNGTEFFGAPLAECADELHAELIAEALRVLKERE